MRTLIAVTLVCILMVMCWPLALVLLILFPFIWLLMLPFRIIGITIEAVFRLIGTILMLPFRIFRGAER